MFESTYKYCSVFFYILLDYTPGSQPHEISEIKKIRTIFFYNMPQNNSNIWYNIHERIKCF